MAKEIIYLTAEGYKKLKDDLDHMRSVERPAISAAIAEARDKGDLSENGGYQAAREEQAKNEGRINELTVKLRNATIVEAPKAGKVGNGSLVTLELAGREMTYALGSRDIKVATKYDVISPESPIGAAILGANEGDTVSYKAPNGREISVVIKEAKPLS